MGYWKIAIFLLNASKPSSNITQTLKYFSKHQTIKTQPTDIYSRYIGKCKHPGKLYTVSDNTTWAGFSPHVISTVTAKNATKVRY